MLPSFLTPFCKYKVILRVFREMVWRLHPKRGRPRGICRSHFSQEVKFGSFFAYKLDFPVHYSISNKFVSTVVDLFSDRGRLS